jgi:hypothetical protein
MRHTFQRALRIATIAVCALTCSTAPVGATTATVRSSAARLTTHTPVMGANLLSAGQLARWYNHVRHGVAPRVPSVGNNIQTLAQLFIEEGRIQGVRGDLAFAQSVIETGWFSFPADGQIRPSFNNFAGLYAYNGRPKGTTCAAETKPSRCFSSARLGIRYQIQLLRGYADATTRHMHLLIHPPSDRIGVAPIWELFGGASGKAIWATSPTYGINIIKLYSQALTFNGARSACLPYAPGSSLSQSGTGYWVVSSDGGVQSFGSAHFHGSAGALHLKRPILGADAMTGGYWLVAGDGGIFNYGTARFYGSTGAMHLNKPVVGMRRTVSGHGYWLVASDGGIFSFGDARFYGSTGAMHLNKPIVGMIRTPTGHGYWLVASDGGIFSFGDAKFRGSLGSRRLTEAIVSMQRTPTGLGYWMLGSKGGVYSFGDAHFYGSVAGCGFPAASRMLVDPSGHGYWVMTVDGTVIALGDARRLGFPARITGTAVGLVNG